MFRNDIQWKAKIKFAFYVSLYYLRVRRLYASAYLPTTESNSIPGLCVCLICLLSILALTLYVRAILLCKLVWCNNSEKYFSILDPHHLSIKIYIHDVIVCKIVLYPTKSKDASGTANIHTKNNSSSCTL